MAAGLDATRDERDVLADVLEVFGADSGLQWQVLAERLNTAMPDGGPTRPARPCRPNAGPAACRPSTSRCSAGRSRAAAAPTSSAPRGKVRPLPGRGSATARGPASMPSAATCRDRWPARSRVAAGRRARQDRSPIGSGNSQHPYQACRDPECERYGCRVWKEAFKEGYDDGVQRTATTPATPDGIRDCPREPRRPVSAMAETVLIILHRDRRLRGVAVLVAVPAVRALRRLRPQQGQQPQAVRRVQAVQGQRAAAPDRREDDPPRRRQPRRQGPRQEEGRQAMTRGTWQGGGTWQTSGGGGGLLLAVIAAAVLIGSGAASAAVSALEVIAIITGAVIALAVARPASRWFVYRARSDRPGRPIAAPPVYQLPPNRGPGWRKPPRRPSARPGDSSPLPRQRGRAGRDPAALRRRGMRAPRRRKLAP